MADHLSRNAYIFAADLPANFSLVEVLCDTISLWAEANNDIALDRAKTCDLRSTCCAGHRADGYLKWGARWCGTIVCQLAVVEVPLEDDQI